MQTSRLWLSVVMPVLNEGPALSGALQALSDWRQGGAELIVVDGGSSDDSRQQAARWADRVLQAPRGRASQMNAGAACARGACLLFLHADTRLPQSARQALAGLEASALWGRFDVRIDDPSPCLRIVGLMMNWRSRWTAVATGDQAMFVRREIFEQVGGFPDIALMEDVALSKRLRALARPVCLRGPALTSARRWRTHGIASTVWLMWRLRAAYFFGADPNDLARRYGYPPRPR